MARDIDLGIAVARVGPGDERGGRARRRIGLARQAGVAAQAEAARRTAQVAPTSALIDAVGQSRRFTRVGVVDGVQRRRRGSHRSHEARGVARIAEIDHVAGAAARFGLVEPGRALDQVIAAFAEHQVVAALAVELVATRTGLAEAGAEIAVEVVDRVVVAGTALRETVDHIVAGPANQYVRPRATLDQVVARAAFDGVLAGPAVDRVVARIAPDPVVAAVAADHVGAVVGAVQQVVAFAAFDGVQAEPAAYHVIAGATVQAVVAVSTVDQVVTTAAVGDVVAPFAVEEVARIVVTGTGLVVTIEDVVAEVAVDGVAAGVAADAIAAESAVDPVVAAAAGDVVRAAQAVDHVVAFAAVDQVAEAHRVEEVRIGVGAVFGTEDGVVAGAAAQHIADASIAGDQIVAVAAVDVIHAVATVKLVVLRAALHGVVATAPVTGDRDHHGRGIEQIGVVVAAHLDRAAGHAAAEQQTAAHADIGIAKIDREKQPVARRENAGDVDRVAGIEGDRAEAGQHRIAARDDDVLVGRERIDRGQAHLPVTRVDGAHRQPAAGFGQVNIDGGVRIDLARTRERRIDLEVVQVRADPAAHGGQRDLAAGDIHGNVAQRVDDRHWRGQGDIADGRDDAAHPHVAIQLHEHDVAVGEDVDVPVAGDVGVADDIHARGLEVRRDQDVAAGLDLLEHREAVLERGAGPEDADRRHEHRAAAIGLVMIDVGVGHR